MASTSSSKNTILAGAAAWAAALACLCLAVRAAPWWLGASAGLIAGGVLYRFGGGARGLARPLGILAGGLFIAAFSLALAELGGRLIFPPLPTTRVAHPEYFWQLRPGGKGDYHLRVDADTSRIIPLRISSQGLRDRVYGPRGEDETRVLLLGDSFTMGVAVREEDTLSARLESQMNARAFPGRRYCVINCGASAYGPWQERGMLLDRGFALEPHVVLLQVFLGNDLHNTLQRTGELLEAYNVRNEQVVERWRGANCLGIAADDFLYHRSVVYREAQRRIGPGYHALALWNLLRFLPRCAAPAFPPSASRAFVIEACLKNPYPLLDEAFDRLVADIAAIRDDCAARGVAFHVYAIPPYPVASAAAWAETVGENGAAHERGAGEARLARMLSEAGIAYFPVADSLMDHPEVESLYYPIDGHCTPEGHAQIAGLLMEHLGDRNLFRFSPPR